VGPSLLLWLVEEGEELVSRGNGEDALEEEGVELLVPRRFGFESRKSENEAIAGIEVHRELGLVHRRGLHAVDRTQGQDHRQGLRVGARESRIVIRERIGAEDHLVVGDEE